jgi:hypothetical protein
MTQEQAKKLPHGLYRIFWKEGGSSLAALGSTHSGRRWIAPCNWTSSDEGDPKVAKTNSFVKIERME